MARKFKELEARMSPEAIRASDATHLSLKEAIELEELRDAQRVTQHPLATTPNVDQPVVSKFTTQD